MENEYGHESNLVVPVQSFRTRTKSKWEVLYEALFKIAVCLHVFNAGFCFRHLINSKKCFTHITTLFVFSMVVGAGCLLVYIVKYDDIKRGEY